MPEPVKSGVGMRKTCVQPVGDVFMTHQTQTHLSTAAVCIPRGTWKNWLVLPLRLHTIRMQFYPRLWGNLTEVIHRLYPFSTPLIIRTIWVNKRNLLIGNGG